MTGLNSKENIKGYVEEIQRQCRAQGCFRVLIEERLEGPRLGAVDVFQIVTEGSRSIQGSFEAIAYVDVNAEGDLMKVAEDVAVNRGLPIIVFSSVGEAEKWLQGEHPGAP